MKIEVNLSTNSCWQRSIGGKYILHLVLLFEWGTKRRHQDIHTAKRHLFMNTSPKLQNLSL